MLGRTRGAHGHRDAEWQTQVVGFPPTVARTILLIRCGEDNTRHRDLHAGTAELAAAEGPPAKVGIDEYLNVARGFFDGAEPGMANAVLDRLARLLRPAAFDG